MRSPRAIVVWVEALIPSVDGLLTRPRRIDVIIAALLGAASLIEFPFLTTPYPVHALVAGLIWAVAAAYRRVSPMYVLVVIAIVAVSGDVVAAASGEPVVGTVGGGLAVMVVLYTIGRWAPPRTVIAALLVLGLAVAPAGFLNSANDPAWAWFLAEVAVSTAIIVIGVLVRSRDVLRTQEARAELAEERNHLANDIHDSVAHHMSAIAIMAEGARQLTDPNERDEALDAIRRSASTGLTDVRHLVAGLRRSDAGPRPLPGLGELKQLGEATATPTLRVEVVVDTAAESVPVAIAAVAYAISREALTNVRRHAVGATLATVDVRATDRFLDLTITDNGTAATPRRADGDAGSHSPSEHGGFGSRIMADRAASVGGSLDAGPDPAGGWRVASRLPLTSVGAS